MWQEGLEIDLDRIFATKIFDQKRCGRHKHFVFFDGDYVYKGPYALHKLQQYQQRVEILQQWQLPLLVFPEKMQFGSPMGYFLRFENLAKDLKMESKIHHESWANGKTYQVLERSGLIKMSDAFKNNRWIDEHLSEVTFVLLCLNLLNVGDLGTYNILVDEIKRKIYIIDFEETRGEQSATGEFFYLSKPPCAALANRWRANLNLQEISRRMESIDHPQKEQLLKKFVTNECQNTRELVYKGQFSTIASGYTLDIAKSGLQKMIRRGETDKALQLAFEIFAFSKIDKAKAIVSNLFNRLCVIAVEDIGPANLPLVSNVLTSFLDEESRTAENLHQMVVEMAQSPKTRICSWLARAYSFENRQISLENGLETEDESRDNDPLTCHFWEESEIEEKPELTAYGTIFWQRLTQRDRNAFVWGQVFLNNIGSWKLTKRRQRRTKPSIILWEMLRSVEPLANVRVYQKIIPLLEKSFFDLDEVAFWRLAVFLAIESPAKPGISTVELPPKTHPECLNDDFESIVLPDFVIDCHTREGRSLKKSKSDFRLEGTKVMNEDQRFVDPQLLQIYLSS